MKNNKTSAMQEAASKCAELGQRKPKGVHLVCEDVDKKTDRGVSSTGRERPDKIIGRHCKGVLLYFDDWGEKESFAVRTFRAETGRVGDDEEAQEILDEYDALGGTTGSPTWSLSVKRGGRRRGDLITGDKWNYRYRQYINERENISDKPDSTGPFGTNIVVAEGDSRFPPGSL